MTNKVMQIVTRKGAIAQTSPQRHTTIQRAAESLSRRVVDAAIVEVLNESLSRLTVLVYERDETGAFCNVDPATGRVLVPLPWGRGGYSKWGLTFSEGETMRRVMFVRQAQGVPLFFFDRSRRAWYLNIVEYGAGTVIKEWEISVAEYRKARG